MHSAKPPRSLISTRLPFLLASLMLGSAHGASAEPAPPMPQLKIVDEAQRQIVKGETLTLQAQVNGQDATEAQQVHWTVNKLEAVKFLTGANSTTEAENVTSPTATIKGISATAAM